MEISQLRTFYEIVKTESYSKASKNLFITQSAVSHQIKNLEKELNFKLFERLGNMMKLTDRGRLLSDAVGTFLDDLDNVKRISEDMGDFNTGHLTISTTSGIMTYVLPDVIKTFMRKFPRIELKLGNWSRSRDFLTMVSSGEVDLVIGPRTNQVFLDKATFLFWKTFGRVLLISKGHSLRKKNVKLAEVCAHPLILYGAGIRRTILEVFAKHKLPYTVIMEIDLAENAKKYIEMGVGACILDSFMITPEERHRFCCVDVSHLFGKVDYGIYYRKKRHITTAMKQFVRLFAPELCETFDSH
jgi:LysR family transcriptional regulator, cys regulon transcriptional activator